MAQPPQFGTARSTSDMKDKATDQFGKMADKATDAAQGVARQVEDFAGKTRERGG